MTIHSDLLQLNSMEILIYFIFKTIKCDRSTWPARRKVDRSTPKSVRTLSVDRPLFRALKGSFTLEFWLLMINLRWRLGGSHSRLGSKFSSIATGRRARGRRRWDSKFPSTFVLISNILPLDFPRMFSRWSLTLPSSISLHSYSRQPNTLLLHYTFSVLFLVNEWCFK